MVYLFYIFLVLGTFALMEVVAWATHKYIMHGFLWNLHRDHHEPHEGFLEHNDWFAVFFATVCIVLFLFGTLWGKGWVIAVAIGILLYGIAYFWAHDIVVHQRIKWFTRSKNKYIRAIRWAHKMHHKHTGREDGESFGFLWVGKKYWQKIEKDDAVREKRNAKRS